MPKDDKKTTLYAVGVNDGRNDIVAWMQVVLNDEPDITANMLLARCVAYKEAMKIAYEISE